MLLGPLVLLLAFEFLGGSKLFSILARRMAKLSSSFSRRSIR